MAKKARYLSIDEIRIIALRRLAEVHGVGEICSRVEVGHSQLVQYIGPNPTRNIGSTFARRVERAFKLPENWLDNLHDDQPMRLHAILNYARNLQPDKFHEFACKIERQIAQIEACLARNGVDPSKLPQENGGQGTGEEGTTSEDGSTVAIKQ